MFPTRMQQWRSDDAEQAMNGARVNGINAPILLEKCLTNLYQPNEHDESERKQLLEKNEMFGNPWHGIKIVKSYANALVLTECHIEGEFWILSFEFWIGLYSNSKFRIQNSKLV